MPVATSALEHVLAARCAQAAAVRERLHIVKPSEAFTVELEWPLGQQVPERSPAKPSPAEPSAAKASPAERLREALAGVGLEPEAVDCFTLAAQTVAALSQGRDLAASLANSPAGSAAQVSASDPSADVRADLHADPGDVSGQTKAAAYVLEGLGAIVSLSARLDAAVVTATRDLTARTGRILLTRKGFTDPGELTVGQREQWRARAKSATRHEIEALTGWGAGEVSDLVGMANAPTPITALVTSAMAAGVAPWRLVRRFWRECSALDHQDAAHVADTLFGADPATAAAERLTPEGTLSNGPWRHREFYNALAREVTRITGRDAAASRAERDRAHARRDARASIDTDGTGAVVVTGTATQVAAIADRLDQAARRARKAGDTRTLAQLRADIALSLLLHAKLALPDLPDDADLVTVEHTDALAAVLHALPAAVLNVIVPYSALHAPDRRPPSAFWPDPPAGRRPPDLTGGAAPPEVELLTVAQVQGAQPAFLTPDHVRELALVPGTVMHRLLIDPATGRSVERSISAYRPDATMRAQILAADVTCRAPGCLLPGTAAQYDHVQEFAAGGPTAETNVQLAHTRHHDVKTQRLWDAVMDEQRNVTWTTVLGKIYRTRCHDYRQYATALHDTIMAVSAAPEADRAGAIDHAISAALSFRGPAGQLRAIDDDPEADLTLPSWDHVAIRGSGHPDPRRARDLRDERPGNPPPPAAPRPAAPPNAGTPWRLHTNDEPPPF